MNASSNWVGLFTIVGICHPVQFTVLWTGLKSLMQFWRRPHELGIIRSDSVFLLSQISYHHSIVNVHLLYFVTLVIRVNGSIYKISYDNFAIILRQKNLTIDNYTVLNNQ